MFYKNINSPPYEWHYFSIYSCVSRFATPHFPLDVT